MNDQKTTVDNLKVFVKNFVDERDWSQFHNPKNISMALAIEASELMDIFKWDSNDEAENSKPIFQYLLIPDKLLHLPLIDFFTMLLFYTEYVK